VTAGLAALSAALAAVAAALAVHRLDARAHRQKTLDMVIDGPVILASGLGFLALFAVSGRPLFSLILTAGGAALLSVVNRLKQRLFHEPIVFLDATLLTQVLRHPGFYVPYLFPMPVLLAGAGAAGLLAVVWSLEPPAAAGVRAAAAWCLAAALAGLALCAGLFFPAGRAAARRILARYAPSLEANADFARFGLLGSFFLHGLWHVHLRGRDGGPGIPLFQADPAGPGEAPPRLESPPHLVLVQAESFFDVRRHVPHAPSALLTHYDRLRAAGTGGLFSVQTHGAYTMRTEFSVLTGLPLCTLGTDALNPYFTASRRRVDSLAWRLRAMGYRTACIHPFRLSFFRRNRVLPNLGFTELYGEEAFAGADRCGPFVSDAALGRFVLDWIAACREPAFVFVITMEAHGPWKPGRLAREPDFRETDTAMGIYLHHLAHTDGLLGKLADGLGSLSRPAALCAYGDHVGCLPDLHDPWDAGHAATDWVLWPAPGGSPGSARSLRPEEIGDVLWDAALRRRP
jgi:hypothetical protein